MVLLKGSLLEANETSASFGICSKSWYLLLLKITEKNIFDFWIFHYLALGLKAMNHCNSNCKHALLLAQNILHVLFNPLNSEILSYIL